MLKGNPVHTVPIQMMAMMIGVQVEIHVDYSLFSLDLVLMVFSQKNIVSVVSMHFYNVTIYNIICTMGRWDNLFKNVFMN